MKEYKKVKFHSDYHIIEKAFDMLIEKIESDAYIISVNLSICEERTKAIDTIANTINQVKDLKTRLLKND